MLSSAQLVAYRGHLIDAVNFLVTDHSTRKISGLLSGLEAAKRQLERGSKQDWILNTDPNWIVPIDWSQIKPDVEAHLLFGADIEVRDGKLQRHVVTFCVLNQRGAGVAGNGESCCLRYILPQEVRIVRKVHFDLDTAHDGADRPRSHFQMGGKLPPLPSGDGYHYCADPKIDPPRIPTFPTDMVILVDSLLRQFVPIGGQPNFLSERRWLKLVQQSEDIWIKPYIAKSSGFLAMQSRSQSLYAALCQAS